MITIIDLLLLIFILILLNYGHYFYNTSNLIRHNNTNPNYARFSKVDTYNYLIFPKLVFTNPIYFILKQGESLYIPKGWWHWIKNTKKTFAVNHSFKNTIHVNSPFIFENKSTINLKSLKNIDISVWNSNTNDITNSTFGKFYNSGIDGNNIVTIDSTASGNDNELLKKKIKSKATLPKHKLVKTEGFGYNIWASSGKHDTGMHYDLFDGILTIIEGEKTITMFPPSDSDYLYPFIV